MRENLAFEPSARLQSILSRELVADPNVAVLEFVKNSYDAVAGQVLIEFEFDDHPREAVLTIADDGEGMDLDEFKQNWMRPGYSEKARKEYRLPGGRVPAGEKGLGRLAAGRLGEVLDVFTRKTSKDPWLHARFVWADFDDMDQNLGDVMIPIDDETEPDITMGDSGTVVEISRLRLNWDAKVPGRKAPGRHPTRIGRLRQDLEMLLLPLGASGEQFEIWVEHNSSQPEDEAPGRIEPPFLELIHYRYDFEVKRAGRGWQVKRVIRRGPDLLEDEVAQGQNLKAREQSTKPLAAPTESTELQDVGPFSGSFYYAPESADRLRRLRAPIGVLLYRDGIRVEPYGHPGNDWLGAQAKKASRQGYAAIQPAALYGAVRITRGDNPHLRSQANREGLIENDAYESFIQICRNEFSKFEEIVFDEYLSMRWQSPQDHRRQEALTTQNYALSLTRTLMHSVNQPVATANATLDSLQTLIHKAITDHQIQAQLQELHDRTAEQLGQIGAAIKRVLDVVDFDPTPVSFDLADLVRDVVEAHRKSGVAPPVDITVDLDGGLEVELPKAPVHEALVELIANAAHAPRSNGAAPEIRITGEELKESVRIVVVDNGEGVDPALKDDLFQRAASTKGSIGMGLILVRQLLHLIRGEVELEQTGSEGATFSISLPKVVR